MLPGFGGVIAAVGHPVDKEAEDAADDEEVDRQGTGHAVVAALQVAVQEHDQRHGGTVGVALAVGEDLGYIEHLQTADDGGDEGVSQNGADQRQGDGEEPPEAAAAVQFGGLEDVGADAHDGGHQHDGGVAEPHQEVHQPDKGPGAEGGAHKVDGGIGQPDGHEDGVDGAVGGEQREEEHGEGRSHDQVGQVDDDLEELLAADLQPHIGEPVGQQQSDDDLGHKADEPEDQGVAGVADHVGFEELGIVFQADEGGADLLDAGAVVFIEAVPHGVHQRDQREDEEGHKERKNEDVAPFGVTEMMLFFLVHKSPFLSGKGCRTGVRQPVFIP